jgi:hypothetical protein
MMFLAERLLVEAATICSVNDSLGDIGDMKGAAGTRRRRLS